MNMNSASHGILTGLKKGDASARHCFFCLWNTGLFDKLMWATKGCLIGILLVVHCNPHKTWAVSPPIYPQKPCFFHCSCWTWWFSETFKPRSSRNPLGRSRLDRQTHGNKIPFKMWLAKNLLETSIFRCNDRMHVLAFWFPFLKIWMQKRCKEKTHRYDLSASAGLLWLSTAGRPKDHQKRGWIEKGYPPQNESIPWVVPLPSNSGKWRDPVLNTKHMISSWWWLLLGVGTRPIHIPATHQQFTMKPS